MTESITETAARKAALRTRMIDARARISLRTRKAAAVAIASGFMGNVPRKAWDVIGAYWPMAGEVDTTLLLEALAEEKHAVALPRAVKRGEALTFHRWQRGMQLERNPKWGTLEPPSGAPELRPTLLLVPLLAFDAAGYRLGFGAGFYDRTLDALSEKGHLFTVGIAYARQQVGYVPREPHDRPLDCIVTEKRVIVAAAE